MANPSPKPKSEGGDMTPPKGTSTQGQPRPNLPGSPTGHNKDLC